MNPLWTLAPPLLVIPFILWFGESRRNLREASIIIAGLLLLLLNNLVFNSVTTGEPVVSGSFYMFEHLTLKLSAEPLGVLFALLASFLWVITTVYSVGYMRGHNEQHQTRFYVCFAIAIAAVMAAAYADNLLTLFVAYEVLSLSTYPLVTHAGTDKARMAGRVYLGILMCASIGLFMPAMIWTWTLTGSLDFMPGGLLSPDMMSPGMFTLLLALFLFGLAKAAVMPLHRWLPAAMVAPTPVSALLHAVAVVKTGVFCLLKIVVYIFGIDTLSSVGASSWLFWFPAFTIVVASLIAFSKDNLKARLAYSTISQLSYIVLAALLASPASIVGGSLHILTHAFAKITLFFCAGAILVAEHKTNVSELRGIGRRMPITMAAFIIGSLGIIGLPPVAGMWSKLFIAQGTMDAQQFWLLAVLMISTLLNVAYLLPIGIRAFFPASSSTVVEHSSSEVASDDKHGGQDHREHEAPLPCLWAIGMTAVVSVFLFVYPKPFLDLLSIVKWQG